MAGCESDNLSGRRLGWGVKGKSPLEGKMGP